MNKRFFLLLTLLTLTLTGTYSRVLADGIPLQDRAEIITTLPEVAAEMMSTMDAFVFGLSDFDLKSKTQTVGPVTTEQYLDYLKQRPMEYSYEEVEKLKRVVASISKKLDDAGLYLPFPYTINVIKTDMKEEYGASAYTRISYIVMGADMYNLSDEEYEKVFIHELFHVLSRNNPSFQEKVYNSLGFKQCNEVKYPEGYRRISNPDAPFNNYYINVGTDDGPADVMLILYSDKDYEGGSFFRYAKLGLMAVEGDDQNKKPVMKDGKPVVLDVSDVTNFFEQVGRNTGYIIHPEELSADHFVMLLNNEPAKNPEKINDLKKLLLEINQN